MKQSSWIVSQIAFAGLALLLAMGPTARASSVTYTYTGNPFNFEASAPWTTSDFVSASFTFSSPLADNLASAFLTTGVESWTINDGVTTFDPSNGATLTLLELSTGPSGNITVWDFNVFNFTTACEPHAFSGWNGGLAPTDAQDQGEYDNACSPYTPPSIAGNLGWPGTWTESQVSPPPSSAPEPSTAMLLVFALIPGLVWLRRRQRIS